MNDIQSLLSGSVSGILGELKNTAGLKGSGGDESFINVFSEIYDMAESTEAENKSSVLSLLSGDVDDISSVLIDAEKAEIALSLTIEIRNKVLEAYNEIMNMQV